MTEATKDALTLCDRCGAILTTQGYRAIKGDRELTLCKPHWREHEPRLTKDGWSIELLEPPEPSAGPRIGSTCANPECGGPQVHRFVKATPESPAVKITHCQGCDVRTCGYEMGGDKRCDAKARTRDERLCPKGHPLFGATE